MQSRALFKKVIIKWSNLWQSDNNKINPNK